VLYQSQLEKAIKYSLLFFDANLKTLCGYIMTGLKFFFIFSIEFLLIFCCTTGTVFGINSTDNKSVQSGDYLNSEVSNVHYSYYHYFFGLNSYGNTVITRNGKLPVLETKEQRESWNSTLEELSNKIRDTIASKYMHPHGQVVTCGANAKGYFVILFEYGNVDEPLINEIYALIDNSAREMGIHDIPVEFGYGIYQEKIYLSQYRYHEFGESIKNLSGSDIHIIEEYMKRKPAQLGDGNIANYGKIPLLKDQEEIHTWWYKLKSIQDSTQEKFTPYMEKDQVRSYGIELTRMTVGISKNLSSEEKTALAKEIYQIIDEEARKQNVTGVPVIFYDQGKFVNLTLAEDGGAVEETSNLSISGEKNAVELNNSSNNDSEFNNENVSSLNNSSGSKSNENKSAPGFGLLGSLICLYGGWRLRKK
jgi:hypothetical protein